MTIKRTIALGLCLFSLSACSSFEGVFRDKDQIPLAGDRISVLQLQQDLVPDATLQSQPFTLPAAWTDDFWPQSGGYPNHAMGHLTLGNGIKKVWSADIGSGGDRRDPLIVQPVVAAGVVYTLDTEANVSAFALADGKRKWRVSAEVSGEDEGSYIGGGLAFASGKIFVTNGYKQLVCLNAADGKTLWRAEVPAPVRAAPTVVDGKVYLLTLDNRLMVYAADDGKLQWNYAGVAETTNLLGSVSPAVNANLVVMPMSSGEVLGLRTENGQVVWQDNLSVVRRSGASVIADIRGQPVIDQGLVYAVSYSGRMVAIDEISGQRVWQRDIGSAEMPWASGDTVFVLSTDQQVLALTRLNGGIRWVGALPRFADEKSKEDPIVWTGPVLAGGRLILASNRGQMVEMDPQNGRVIKTTKLSGNVMVPPVVAGNTLLILTDDGDLVAYR